MFKEKPGFIVAIWDIFQLLHYLCSENKENENGNWSVLVYSILVLAWIKPPIVFLITQYKLIDSAKIALCDLLPNERLKLRGSSSDPWTLNHNNRI